MDRFIGNILTRSDFVTGVYFAVQPNLAGFPLVSEIFFERDGYGSIVEGEQQDYEDYMDIHCEEMEWFYGAYNSGQPYWTGIYEWIDGTVVVSYVEPVIINNERIGVVGVDISIDNIVDLIIDYKIYNTGFALIKDKNGDFFETGNFINQLSNNEKNELNEAGWSSNGNIFKIKLGGSDYIVTQNFLENDYSIYIFVPEREFSTAVRESLLRFALLFPLVFLIISIFCFFVGKSISKPFIIITKVIDSVAAGEFHTSPLEPIMKLPDETGILARAVRKLRIRLGNLTREMQVIANKDLSCDIKLEFEGDSIGIALDNTLRTLNLILAQIHEGMEEVSKGSRNIADNSESLSQGAQEQSAAIEELSATISNIKEQISRDADVAREASELSSSIRNIAEKGNEQMDNMMNAVREIDAASIQIEKVIKVIEDIAFQTNILALNAAVEAARAGDAGKGFAVVADEVRNLASKSAEAAKNSTALISNTVEKAHLGLNIASETANSLNEIVDGINKCSEIVKLIADSSNKQASVIGELNKSINQVSDIIQQNSEAAAESAVASMEMNNQAEIVEKLIAQFKLKDSNAFM
jgi:methyl-accepting chemotaxis protein